MRVGTSDGAVTGNKSKEDHPHACGDKKERVYSAYTVPGSSPCVWGQVALAEKAETERRIIPMRVGTRFCV